MNIDSFLTYAGKEVRFYSSGTREGALRSMTWPLVSSRVMNVLSVVYLSALFLSDSWQKSMESKIALTQRSAIVLCLHTRISL